jgi:hypothetical protein
MKARPSWRSGLRIAALTAALLLPACGGSASTPLFWLSGSQFAFTGTEGGTDPADQTLVFTSGERLMFQKLQWFASWDQPWLAVSPVSGTIDAGTALPLSLHVDMTAQTEGWVGATSTVNAPVADATTLAGWGAWIGNRMLIWSGNPAVPGKFYNPATNTWSGATSTVGAPSERSSFSAVWTGAEMVVWGGHSITPFVALNTGARYNPVTDTWTPTSTVGAPSPRAGHRAVWTGRYMIVWGGDGLGFTYTDTGGIYDPATDTWLGATSTVSAPSPRSAHAAVWTGTRLLVWGGENPGKLGDGKFYDPETDTWSGSTTLTGSPGPRSHMPAVWTGHEMIVWGGFDGGNNLDTGARYNPLTDSWVNMPVTGAPEARSAHNLVWTGNAMIAWGGVNASTNINTGGVYRPPVPVRGSHTANIRITAVNGDLFQSRTVTVNLTVGP